MNDGGHGFLLARVSATGFFTTAVPELSTWAMMLVGFAGLGSCRRRARAAGKLIFGFTAALATAVIGFAESAQVVS